MDDSRYWWIWKADKTSRGIFGSNTVNGPDKKEFPYQLEMEQPPCPDKPEYPDGLYMVESSGGNGLRRKRRGQVYYLNGETTGVPWSKYKVIATLEGVKFVDGRDQDE